MTQVVQQVAYRSRHGFLSMPLWLRLQLLMAGMLRTPLIAAPTDSFSGELLQTHHCALLRGATGW